MAVALRNDTAMPLIVPACPVSSAHRHQNTKISEQKDEEEILPTREPATSLVGERDMIMVE